MLTLLFMHEFFKSAAASAEVVSVTMHINEHVRRHENFMKMLSIQQSLVGPSIPSILSPARSFIYEGGLMKVGGALYKQSCPFNELVGTLETSYYCYSIVQATCTMDICVCIVIVLPRALSSTNQIHPWYPWYNYYMYSQVCRTFKYKKASERMVFLFSDVLIYAKPTRTEKKNIERYNLQIKSCFWLWLHHVHCA